MTYFVTGATGFIGRHLVEELLDREGDVHVLVREGSQRAARRADRSRWGGERRVKPVRRRPDASRALGVDPALDRRARGQDRPLLPPRRRLRHDRRRGAQRARRTSRARATPSTLANALDAGCLHHVSSIAVAGAVQGPVPRGHVRRGPAARHRLPPHEVRVRADRARGGAACPGGSTARRSSSATRAPARWTRSTAPTTSSS